MGSFAHPPPGPPGALSWGGGGTTRGARAGLAAPSPPGGRWLWGPPAAPPILPPAQTVTWREAGETIEELIPFDAAPGVGTSMRLHRHDDGSVERFVRR